LIGENEYSPEPLVARVKVKLLSALVRVTVAPLITAPDESVIVPEILP
jgi:hypothetical protein